MSQVFKVWALSAAPSLTGTLVFQMHKSHEEWVGTKEGKEDEGAYYLVTIAEVGILAWALQN